MKNLKTIIKNVEVIPAKGDYKESYKITYGSGTFLYCYSKEVFDYLDKCKDKEVVLQLEEGKKSKKDYIAGVEGLEVKKKSPFPFKPKEISDKEIKLKCAEISVLAGRSNLTEIIELAREIFEWVKEGK